MVLRIPVLCHGYWFDGGETVQLAVSVVLVTLYLLGWLVFWKEDSVRKSLALAILPSLLFLERGILIANIPLLVLAVLFAPCHIAISYGNAKALDSGGIFAFLSLWRCAALRSVDCQRTEAVLS